MSKTKKPSGLGIKRSGGKFECSWKIADKDYGDGQQFEYRTSNMKAKSYTSEKIGTKTTSKTITINKKSYYPYIKKDKNGKPKKKKNKKGKYVYDYKPKLTSFTFRVRGNRDKYKTKKTTENPSVSDWSSKSFAIEKPPKPSVGASLNDTLSNVCTFAWACDNSQTNHKWFTDIQYETAVTENDTSTKNAKWEGTTSGKGASGRVTYKEEPKDLIKTSYTRHFRCRSRGPAGASDWAYAKHTYAVPNSATINNATLSSSKSEGLTCYVKWTLGQGKGRPTDSVTVEYTITVPEEDMSCPSGSNWTVGKIVKDGKDADAVKFYIDDTLGLDQCLFVRVATQHDTDSNWSAPYRAKGQVLQLKKPTGLSTQVSEDGTYRVAVTVTNASDVPDSFIAIEYRTVQNGEVIKKIIGVIPESSGGQSKTVYLRCPKWEEGENPAFVAYAVVGDYESDSITEDGVTYTEYKITSTDMKSDEVSKGGIIPRAPENVVFTQLASGAVNVTWDWTWNEADIAELSWADHEDAWESTDEPQTYRINSIHAASWNIYGLTVGDNWYIRVRLIMTNDDTETVGPWSKLQDPVNLASAPNVPILTLTPTVIAETGETVASWNYVSNDGTDQDFAELVLVTIDEATGNLIYNDSPPIARIEGIETSYTLKKSDVEWQIGQTYSFALRVTSTSGRTSGWSDTAIVNIADPLEITVETNLTQETVPYDPDESADTELSEDNEVVTEETSSEDESPTSRTDYYLEDLPLEVTVTGAGESGSTTVSIARSEPYHADRPDESEFNGFANETIAIIGPVSGENTISIDTDTDGLVGSIDDTAQYNLICTIYDELGQTKSSTIPFTVRWKDQAKMPEAEVQIDEENYICKIKPKLPSGVSSDDGNVCDIYRLSADKPQLIVQDGIFGTTYVDPYPAIGSNGGHRVVFKTKNGDYIINDDNGGSSYAWIDLGEEEDDILETPYTIINFGTGQLRLLYNIDISNTWNKDFKETKYLGGHVQGDWNPAVSRTGTINAVTVIPNEDIFNDYENEDTITTIRRLADYPGACHLRSRDGSSITCDIEVSENMPHDSFDIASYTLNFTRVDPEDLDGMTLERWNEINGTGGE